MHSGCSSPANLELKGGSPIAAPTVDGRVVETPLADVEAPVSLH